MAKEQSIAVYGNFLTPEEVWERESWHETTYIECEIPKQLEQELSEMIEEKIKEF